MFTSSNLITIIAFLFTILAKHFADKISEAKYKTIIEMRLAQVEREILEVKQSHKETIELLFKKIDKLSDKVDELNQNFIKCPQNNCK
jgi:uncharacterized coiled-coil DUF342 family protein